MLKTKYNHVTLTEKLPMNILFHVLILLPLSFKYSFPGVYMETLQTVFIMRIHSKYPAREKMGKEKKKKRGEEERKQI